MSSGELKHHSRSFIDPVKSDDVIVSLKNKIKELKEENSRLKKLLKVNGIPYSEKEKIETGHTRQRAKTMKTGTTQLSGEHKHKRSHEGIPGSLLKYNTPETIKIIVKMQAIVRGNRVRKAVQMMKKRFQIVKEISETEASYVKSLKILTKRFIRPLEEQGIIDSKDRLLIFGDNAIDQIVFSNGAFAKSLHSLTRHWNFFSKVGDEFLRIVPRLGPHIAYSINYTRGLNRLKELKTTSEPLRIFLGKAGEAPECKKMDLEDFLIMPVQRVMRYPLLLRDLLKETHPLLPDYSSIKIAIDRLASFAKYIDDRTVKKERLVRIANTFVGFKDLVTKDRLCWTDPAVVRIDKDKKQFVMYLFSDCLAWGVQDKKLVKFVDKRNFKDSTIATIITTIEKFPNTIQITSFANPTLQVHFETSTEMNVWYENIVKILQGSEWKENQVYPSWLVYLDEDDN